MEVAEAVEERVMKFDACKMVMPAMDAEGGQDGVLWPVGMVYGPKTRPGAWRG